MFQTNETRISYRYRRFFNMGTITVTGALVVIIGWITLVEFDQSSEQERKRILDKIKNSPMSILIVSLMPIGIIVNLLGSYMASLWMVMVGASLILYRESLFHFYSGIENVGKVSFCLS